MSVDLSIWDRLTRVVVFLIFVAAVLGVVLWYKPVIDTNERMRKTKLELDLKIERELEAARKLDLSIKSLQDPKTVERLARERLSYARPGEIVLHFEPGTAPLTNPAATATNRGPEQRLPGNGL